MQQTKNNYIKSQSWHNVTGIEGISNHFFQENWQKKLQSHRDALFWFFNKCVVCFNWCFHENTANVNWIQKFSNPITLLNYQFEKSIIFGYLLKNISNFPQCCCNVVFLFHEEFLESNKNQKWSYDLPPWLGLEFW